MFIHKKQLMHPVHVTNPDPKFGQVLLEQFGGATGELTAALQYFTQAQHTDDKSLRDMLLDIAIEEFSHLEVVAHLIEAHTKGRQQDEAYRSTLFAIRGKGPHLLDSQGAAWSGDYVNEGASPVRDLRANIAAEGGALATYEALLAMVEDEGSRKALQFLGTREVSHTQMFMDALKAFDKLDQPLFGDLQPDETVDLYFNLSSNGADQTPAPWIENSSFKYIEDPLASMPKEKRQ